MKEPEGHHLAEVKALARGLFLQGIVMIILMIIVLECFKVGTFFQTIS